MAVGPLAAQEITVRGRLTAAGGGPLAGARVELQPLLSNHEVELALLARRPSPPPVDVASTDADGRYVLDAPAPGVFRVVAGGDGLGKVGYLLLPLTGSVELPPVTLPRVSEAVVTIVGNAGEPLADASVYVRSALPGRWRRFSGNGWRAADRLGWTDDQGRLAVPHVAGERLHLDVFPPRSTRSWSLETSGGETFRVGTESLRPRTVEVRDASGRPVSGAVVAAGDLAWPAGRTGDDGRVTVEVDPGAPPTLHVIVASGRRLVAALEADAGETDVLALPELQTLDGRVTNAAGEGIAGALVWPTYDPGAFLLADSEGVFRLAAPPDPRFRLQAEAVGFLPLSALITAEDAGRKTIPPLRLAAASTLRGRVVDAAGAPLAGVALTALAEAPRRRAGGYQPDEVDGRAWSDARGRFTFVRLPPAERWAVTAERPGYTTAELWTSAAEASEEGLRIVLEEGRLLFGRVLDVDEHPLADAEVVLRPAATEDLRRTECEPPFCARSDADGRFELHQAPASKLDVEARRRGFAPLTVRAVEVPPGQGAVDLGTFVLGPGATLEGRVGGPGEKPLEGARLWLAEDRGAPPARIAAERLGTPPDAVAGADGGFVIEDLEPEGRFHLLADHDGYLPAVVAVQAGGEAVTAVLREASQVSGRVVDEDGAPVTGAEVELHRRRDDEEPLLGDTWTSESDAEGRFTLADVAPGSVTVSAWARGFQPSSERTLELGTEPAADLELVLARGAVLEGWVSGPGGGPVAEARVAVGRPWTSTDAEGHYHLEGVAPGPGRVTVDHPGYNPLEEEVEVEPGTQRVDFVLRGGSRVAGRVVDEDGLPVADVRLELEPDALRAARSYRTASEADGVFAWPRVADGGYTLAASGEGYVVTREAVEVAASPVEGLEVVLRRGAVLEGRVLGLLPEEIARLRVSASPEDGPEEVAAVDWEGRYEILDLAPGDWRVRAWLPGGGRQVEAWVTLEPGAARATRDLEFGAGFVVTGRVFWGGEPLPDAAVVLRGQDVAAERQVTTNADGRFEVADVLAGRYHLGVTERRRSIVHNEEVDLDGDRDLLIEIATAGISGRVVSAADARPLADALVALRQLLPSGGEGSLFTASTDAEGLFREPRLPAGGFRLTVRLDGYRPFQDVVDLPPGVPLEVGEIALEPTSGLDLVVRLASGGVPRLVNLRALDASGRTVVAETRVADVTGAVRFPTVPPGRWRLLLSSPESALASLEAEVPGAPVEVVLPGGGGLRVRVPALLDSDVVAVLTITAGDGRPFLVLEPGGELQDRWSVASGRASVPSVPAGAWHLRVTTPTGEVFTGTAVTTGAPDVEVVLE